MRQGWKQVAWPYWTSLVGLKLSGDGCYLLLPNDGNEIWQCKWRLLKEGDEFVSPLTWWSHYWFNGLVSMQRQQTDSICHYSCTSLMSFLFHRHAWSILDERRRTSEFTPPLILENSLTVQKIILDMYDEMYHTFPRAICSREGTPEPHYATKCTRLEWQWWTICNLHSEKIKEKYAHLRQTNVGRIEKA